MDIIHYYKHYYLVFLLIVLSIILSITFYLSIIKIENKESITIRINKRNEISIPLKIIKEEPIGFIQIPSLNLKKDLYDINSKENNIEKNVTILRESNYPNRMILAAHSGEGNIAYFNDLINLKGKEEIILFYQGEYKKYQVSNIRNMNKNGYIQITNHKENTLILTTCNPYDLTKQLIVNCIEKES